MSSFNQNPPVVKVFDPKIALSELFLPKLSQNFVIFEPKSEFKITFLTLQPPVLKFLNLKIAFSGYFHRNSIRT